MEDNRHGFVLAEIVAMIGLLLIIVAIAVPQFLDYRSRGFRALVEQDARNAARAQETHFADNNKYTSSACDALPGFVSSKGVECDTIGDTAGFAIWTWHQSADASCILRNEGPNGYNLYCDPSEVR